MSNRSRRTLRVPPGMVRIALLLVLAGCLSVPAIAAGDEGSDPSQVLAALQDVSGVVKASKGVDETTDADSAIATQGADATVDVPVDPSAAVTVGADSGSTVAVTIPNADGAGDAQHLANGLVEYPDVAPSVDIAVQAVPAEPAAADVQDAVQASSVPVIDTDAVDQQAQAAGDAAAAAATSTDASPPADATAGPVDASPSADAPAAPGDPPPAANPILPPDAPAEIPGVLTLFSMQDLAPGSDGAQPPADQAPAPAADPTSPASSLAAEAPATVDISQAPEIPPATPLALGLGVRFLTVITGPDAPADYSYPIGIPDGGSIEQIGQSFLISDADGLVVAMIPSPWAKDATGAQLPVSYTLDGTTVQVHVDDSQAIFPVVLDPKVADAGASARAAAAAADAARQAAAAAAAAHARAEEEARAAAAARAQAQAQAAAQAQARARAAAEAAARAAAEQKAREEAAARAREAERQAAIARAKQEAEAFAKRQLEAAKAKAAAEAAAAKAKAAVEAAAAAAAKAKAAAATKGCTPSIVAGIGVGVGVGCIGTGSKGEPGCPTVLSMCIPVELPPPPGTTCVLPKGQLMCPVSTPVVGPTDQCAAKAGVQSNPCTPPVVPSCDLKTSPNSPCTGNDTKPQNCATGQVRNPTTQQCVAPTPPPCPDGTPRQSILDLCFGHNTLGSSGASSGTSSGATAPPLNEPFTDGNFRRNLEILINGGKPEASDEEAHHVFPQTLRPDFLRIGINVDDPHNGSWVPAGVHRQWSGTYEQDWRSWFDDRKSHNEEPTAAGARQFARMLSGKYDFELHF